MGYYVNPPDMEKEKFLEKHGTLIDPMHIGKESFEDNLPVCLVDNRAFTAAAICYCKEEFDEFSNLRDGRKKKWYTVSRELLKPYYNPKGE